MAEWEVDKHLRQPSFECERVKLCFVISEWKVGNGLLFFDVLICGR